MLWNSASAFKRAPCCSQAQARLMRGPYVPGSDVETKGKGMDDCFGIGVCP